LEPPLLLVLDYTASMAFVQREKFESIVGNLLRQKHATREQQKIGSPRTSGTIIPPTPQLKPDTGVEPSAPSA
jgi:hypothetical protein